MFVHIPCQVEERIQCTVSGQVRYTQREDKIWQLPVAIEAATNKSRGYPTTQNICLACISLFVLLALLCVGEYDAWMKKKAELQAAKQRMLVMVNVAACVYL